MSNYAAYRFQFDATSDNPNAMPYVSKLTWNTQLARIEHSVYPMTQQTLSATSRRVYGEFTALPYDIIETRRGALTRKRKTVELLSRFLVTPRGYLVLIGEGSDVIAFERITQYLQGNRAASSLGNHHKDITDAVSDWKALTELPSPTSPGESRLHQLAQRKRALELELKEITKELASLTATPSRP
jgi:hypothetical protein